MSSVATRTAEGLDDEVPMLIHGVVSTAALPCYGAGGESVCNPATGNYDITANHNTCCTRDCTQIHEERHVTDLGFCCAELAARIAEGGDAGELVGEYNRWMNSGAKAWTECNAYRISVDCAQSLRGANSCGTSSSTCCTEINDYLADMRAARDRWCGTAPKHLPLCPFLPVGDFPLPPKDIAFA